eukprot:TRINITY_DN18999_c0_g1_i1.p1 TRINITY_DN18999_c0_g1~~TRINITY_DN18999_c0_g1_i1.p1  ORF type:complete len:224 (-),score=48.74 TRINITY_DN18999_c0_g1_i1:414-1085(-)
MSFRPPRLVLLSGSVRRGSLNLQLAAAVRGITETFTLGGKVSAPEVVGAEETAELMRRIPMFTGEEEGYPEAADELKQRLAAADGLIFCSPEYNGSVTPILKNTLDWLSRPTQDGEQQYMAFAQKAGGILSASPGPLGGLRAHSHLRDILAGLGVSVVGRTAAVGSAFKSFDEHGRMVHANQERQVKATVEEVVKMAGLVANAEMTCQAVMAGSGCDGTLELV